MNRRSFLKAMAAAGLAVVTPEIIVPERRVFALDRTMLTKNHARYLQWHIDRGIPIPRGYYTLDEPLFVRPQSKGIILENSYLVSNHDGTMLTFQRPMGERDFVLSNVFRSEPSQDMTAKRDVLLRIEPMASGVFDFGGSYFETR